MKKLLNYAVIAVITIVLLGTSSLVAQEWTKEQKEVWQVVQGAWADWQKGDFDANFASVHEKYMGWNHEDPLPTNKEKWYQTSIALKDFAKLDYYDIEPARILVYENVAVVHYYYENYITFTKGDETTEYHYKGKNAEFYINEDGKWMLIGDMTVWKDKK